MFLFLCIIVFMNKTFIPAILVLIAVFFLHVSGSNYGFYNSIWWYDVMMHILGGVGIALSVYWFLRTINKDKIDKNIFIKVIIYTILAGLLWEGIEAYYDIASAPIGSRPYFIDTIKDLIDDTIGGLIVMFFINKIKK